MPRPPYKQPPVIEALCEIHFEPGQVWDVTLLGLYYERVKNAFSAKRELRNVEVSVQAGPAAVSQQVREVGVRMQFVRPDRTAMVQVAPNLLVVNQLPPYRSWADFRALIEARLGDYLEVAKPKGIRRVGLRYINRFDFAPSEFDVQKFFAKSALIPAAVFETANPFLFRLEIAQNKDELVLFTMGMPGSEEDKMSVVLDLDHVSQVDRASSSSDLLAHLDVAHDRIETIFESCLTKALRERLNQEV